VAETTLYEHDHGAQSDLFVVPTAGGAAHPLTATASADEGSAAWQAQPKSLGRPDFTSPVFAVHPARGRPGKVAHFPFTVKSERSGLTRDRVEIFRGRHRIAWFESHLNRTEPGAWWFEWRVPRADAGRTLRFCITSADAYGNLSAERCAPLKVRRR
jgi:hypothetical protein